MDYKIGFIGCGNMATAIIDMLIVEEPDRLPQSRAATANIINLNSANYEIFVSDKNKDATDALKSRHSEIKVINNNKELAALCDIIILAIKPDSAADVLKEISKSLSSEKILVSIMAGVKISAMSKYAGCKIVRTMPNLAAKIGCSTTAISSKDLDESDFSVVKNIFTKIGKCEIVSEESLDAVTAISGSGPAYIYKFIDGMIKAGVKCGLSYTAARSLTINTVIGAGRMCEVTDSPLPEMIDAVCSKGGTTIEAVKVFNERELEKIIDEAVKAAYNKSKLLSEG